jgi:DNA repair exonuclease SbcCD nuclease subunit
MKIFLTSDWHIGIYNLNLNDWIERQRDYFYNFFIPTIKEKYQEGDILIHLGDLYDNRTFIDIKAMNFAEQLIKDIASIIPFHLIVGNHDMYHKSEGDINSVNLFKHIENVYVYKTPQRVNFGDKTAALIPWIDKRKKQIEVLKEMAPADYLFCHSDLNGCKLHMNSVSHRSSDRIDLDEFQSYKRVYAGHVHITQKQGNFTYVGSPMEYDRGDRGNKKGIFILDTLNDSEEFVLNDISPKFIKLSLMEESDIDKLDTVNPNHDYIDLSVSNSLLVNNRKIRRKLEKILETSQFSSIDYVNDLIVENKNEEVEDNYIDLDGVGLNTFDDFKDIILLYINKKKYDSGEIKEGINKEFNKILEIWRTKNIK